jgi:hypothetical protein
MRMNGVRYLIVMAFSAREVSELVQDCENTLDANAGDIGVTGRVLLGQMCYHSALIMSCKCLVYVYAVSRCTCICCIHVTVVNN